MGGYTDELSQLVITQHRPQAAHLSVRTIIICSINGIKLHIQLAILNMLISVDSKSVLYALKYWDCKMRGDMFKFYEVNYVIHCILYGVLGLSFVGHSLTVVFIGKKYQIN